jgi:hypothetical protein
MAIWWYTWNQMGLLGSNIASYNTLQINRGLPRPSNWSIPAAELAVLFMTVTIAVTVFMRRVIYCGPVLLHRLAGICLYVTAIWHAWSFW